MVDYEEISGEKVLIIEDCRPGGPASGQIGTLEGTFAPARGATPNPRIRLQDGSAIWGYECWWKPIAMAGPWATERDGLERWKAVLRLMMTGLDGLPPEAMDRIALHD